MAEKLGFRSVSFVRLEPNQPGEPHTGKRAVIRDVSFSARVGEITVIAGPSGSGKSTLLRLANRLLLPTAGSIHLSGQDISLLEVTSLRRRVGLVQQTPALFAGPVVDNVLYGPRLLPEKLDTDKAEELAAKSLAMAGLDETFLQRKSDELSGGEMQRVAVARILANQPEVILLDEPTSSLDPASTFAFERRIKALGKMEEHAILFVTHDVEQAKRVGDRAILIVNGKIEDEGPLPDLFIAQKNEATRAFVNGEL
ncbi:MAG: ATP-binding cassette domain-containing protein [Candidatus Coatesbacteria bacterium]|nr:ATP-binding cassette domain-containing protein [Candidatus Coatesbacteria bacterium]